MKLSRLKYPEYPLSRLVHSLAITESENARKLSSGKNLPSGFFRLIFNLGDPLMIDRFYENITLNSGDYAFFGQSLKSWELRLPERLKLLEIRFFPWTIEQFSRVPMAELAGKSICPEVIFGKEIRALSARLTDAATDTECFGQLEAFCEEIMRKYSTNKDSDILKAVTSTVLDQKGRIAVSQLSEQLAVSRRTIELTIKKKLGITVTEFARKIRLRKVATTLSKNPSYNYTDLTYDCGYFDQSHFIHDFKKITDESPKQFFDSKPFVEDFLIQTDSNSSMGIPCEPHGILRA